MRTILVALTVAMLSAPTAPAQPAPSYGLSIAYADGRTTVQPLRPYGAFWTPMFPRIGGADTTHSGRALDVLDVTFTAAPGTSWPAVTLFRVFSVVWDDGSVDGDEAPAAAESSLARRRVQQLQSIVDLLQSTAASLDELRAAFARLDRADIALEHARSEALSALDQIATTNDVTELDRWKREAGKNYAEWLERAQRVRK
jgi:hypothetical protein